MPAPISAIPNKYPIVDQGGRINLFFRQLWEAVRLAVQTVSTIGTGYTGAGLTAALVSQLLYTTTQSALYRVTYYVRKTAPDGAGSSLTFRWHWTESGIPLSKTDAALTTDTTGAVASGSCTFWCDANVGITADLDYASTTPAKMTYAAWARVEQLN